MAGRLLLLLPTLLAAPAFASYLNLPAINLTGFQQLGIAGQYGGISFYTDNLQTASLDPSRSSFLFQTNGSFELLATTNDKGVISTACSLPRTTDPTGSTIDIYIGGNFTAINNSPVSNIARFDPQTQQIFPLLTGLDGPVRTLYCDKTSNSVYVGGAFKAPVVSPPLYFDQLGTFGGNVAVWANGNWSGLPWKGFSGPVNVITYNPQTQTILFGGAFDGTTDGAFEYAPTSQPLNLGAATFVEGGNTGFTTGLDNPNSVICSNATDLTTGASGSQWLMQDNIPGWWQANMPYDFTPSLFRLRNSQYQGRGTKTFGILALPDNTFYNVSYVDPATHAINYCTMDCTLSNDSTIQYQDFKVETPISAEGIRIDITDWYGAGAGLASVQIFQAEVIVRAQSGLNFPNCSATPFQASANTTGNWTATTLEGSWRPILADSFPATNLANSTDSITFTPYLPEQGLYQIYMITPGCPQVADCDERVLVDVTLVLAPNETFVVQLDQNTPTDRYDLLWDGYVAATQPGVFIPSVTIKAAKNATTTSTNVELVADSVQFLKNSTTLSLSSVLEFSAANFSKNASAVSWRPLGEQLPPFSTVNDIETSTGDLYIGGRFVGSTGYSNIVKYTYSPTPRLNLLSSGGLNGNVSVLTLVNGDLFVGGSFSATANNSHKLNNVARYTITNNTNQWHSLESGVNGPVTTIVPLTGTTSQTPHARLHISGNFTQLISTSFSGQPELSTGYALWNTATNAWQASPPGVPFIDGTASVILPYINATNASNIMQATFFAGRLSGAQNLQAFGLSSLNSNETSITPGLSPYPLFDPTSFFASSANTTPFTVNAGVFWTDPNNGNASVTIVGGSFQITEGVRDLAFYENGTWSGAIGTPWVGVVDALAIYNNTLYIGGVFNVSTSNGALMSHSIVAWDLLRKTYLPLSDLSTNSGAEARVHVLQFRPDTGLLIVAGLFDKAGSLPCSGVCSFDTSKMQWYALGLGIQGEARDLDFVDSSVYVAGDLSLNGASVRVAQFDFNSQQWSPLGPQTGDDSLPGPAVAVTYDHITGKTFIAGSSVNGSYLRQYDGSKYIVLTPELKPNTYITQLFVVPATPQNASAPENNVIKKDTMLMVAGLLDIPGFGNVSAALFDGVDWYPYLVATGASGGPGVINSIFFKNCCPLSGGRSFLPIPIVILISIAIALGLVFFIVLVALAILYLKRKREAQQNPNPRPESYYGKPPRRPQSLLAMLGPGADNVLNNPEKTAAAAAAARSDSRASHRRPDSGLAHEMVESAVVSGALSGAGSTAAIASYRNGSRDHLQQPDPARPDSEIFQSIYATDRPESQDYYSSFAPIGRSSAMRTESTDYSIAFGSEYESISALAVAPGSRSETAADFSTYYSDEPGTDMGLRDSAASEFGSLSTPVRGFAAMMTAAAMNDTAVPASEDHPHLYYAKYQFKAREHGELGFEVGDRIVVVDTSDDIWWMGSKDNGLGEPKQGVFPSNYVSKTPPSPQPAFLQSS